MEARLTVYFDDPFWVGVFERIEDSKLSGIYSVAPSVISNEVRNPFLFA